jgi:hypothetical protein
VPSGTARSLVLRCTLDVSCGSSRDLRTCQRPRQLSPEAAVATASTQRQWKTPRRRRAALIALGVRGDLRNMAGSGPRHWRMHGAERVAELYRQLGIYSYHTTRLTNKIPGGNQFLRRFAMNCTILGCGSLGSLRSSAADQPAATCRRRRRPWTWGEPARRPLVGIPNPRAWISSQRRHSMSASLSDPQPKIVQFIAKRRKN